MALEGGPDHAIGLTEQCQLLSTDAFADRLAVPNGDSARAACMLVPNWFAECEDVEDPVCPAP